MWSTPGSTRHRNGVIGGTVIHDQDFNLVDPRNGTGGSSARAIPSVFASLRQGDLNDEFHLNPGNNW